MQDKQVLVVDTEEDMYMDQLAKMESAKKFCGQMFPTPVTYRRLDPKIGRNAACPCGSGRKYKRCCIKTIKAGVFNAAAEFSHENLGAGGV